MAVLNLSPDSFYRPSRFPVLDEALRAVERFVEEGADLLDIGAESSRPGAKPIAESLESERLTAVVEAVVKRFPLPVSVDTCKPKVAARVLDQGAVIINDITGLQRHPEMAGIVARQQAGVIIMHMQGAP
ncbi:MAG: dihydropteroate synthase, partial [Nitrospinaceae bacterium]